MKFTFFVESAVGFVENPAVVLTRGLAHGLSLRGNEVRIVEERQNAAFARTLRVVGAAASRHFYDGFRTIQHHTFEPRSGAALLEWVTRELALIDVAVAVAGVNDELCRWLANVSQEGLTRTYLTFEPETLTDEIVASLELDKFDFVLAPREPVAKIAWRQIVTTVAGQDRVPLVEDHVTPIDADVDPIRAAEVFEAAVAQTPGLVR